MKRVVRLVTIAVGLAFCVWLYFAPHLTVRSMRLAAERGDAQALAAHVDFPALRESVKTQLADIMRERIGASGDSDRDNLGALRDVGARFATMIATPMIEAIVSPQALSLLFAGKGLARDGLAAATGTSDQRGGGDLPEWNATMAYEDLHTFAVTLHPDGDIAAPAKLIFKRNNLLWWKLSAVEMPRD